MMKGIQVTIGLFFIVLSGIAAGESIQPIQQPSDTEMRALDAPSGQSLWKVSMFDDGNEELSGADRVVNFSTGNSVTGNYSVTALYYSDSGCTSEVVGARQTYNGAAALANSNKHFYIRADDLFAHSACDALTAQYVKFRDDNNVSNITTCAQYTVHSSAPRYCALNSGTPVTMSALVSA